MLNSYKTGLGVDWERDGKRDARINVIVVTCYV